MCLAIPGKVMTRYERDELTFGLVDFGGVRREICLHFTPDAQLGDYVIAHVGVSISVLDEQAANRTLAAFAELVACEEEK